MAKRIEQNERAKHDYIFFLEETEGLDAKSTDKVLAAIRRFEESTGFKLFAKFHIEYARTNAGGDWPDLERGVVFNVVLILRREIFVILIKMLRV